MEVESLSLTVDMVFPLEALVGYLLVSSIKSHIMVGIWLEGDWLKEIFSSAQSTIGWYMEVPHLVGIFTD